MTTVSGIASTEKITTACANLGTGFIAQDVVPLLQQLVVALGNVTTGGGGGTGNVTGPASAVDGNVAVFSGTTGKVIADGGTLGTAAFYNATAQSQAGTVLFRNANQNTFANNFISSYTAVASAGGTTVLTAASSHNLELTGTLAQTFQLPNATTLTAGSTWNINNNSTGVLTIKNNGSTTLTTVPAGGQIIIIATSVATTDGTWDYHFGLSSEISCSDTDLILGGKTFAWSNSLTLAGTDGSTLNVGAGGTLGTAAFTAATAYAAASQITGGGVIATGGFTLTIPATGTAALLATANTFTAAQTINASTLATAALSSNQTWNSVGTTCRGVEITNTVTNAATASTHLRIRGGAAGTAERLSVTEEKLTVTGAESSGRVLDLISIYGTTQFNVSGGGTLTINNSFTSVASTGEVRSSIVNNGNFFCGIGFEPTPNVAFIRPFGTGATTLQIGVSAASPVSHTLRGASARAGTDTNVAGANLSIAAGNGTGTGGSGSLILQTAAAGSTGSTANTLTNRLVIDKDGGFDFVSLNPTAAVSVASTHKAAIKINGATYYLLLSNV